MVDDYNRLITDSSRKCQKYFNQNRLVISLNYYNSLLADKLNELISSSIALLEENDFAPISIKDLPEEYKKLEYIWWFLPKIITECDGEFTNSSIIED